jgi:DNA-binding PadR family transcriptional regulator
MLVLRTLTCSRCTATIAQHIERLSQSVFPGEHLHPALERLQQKGWVKSKWDETPTGRRARYYTITASGRASSMRRLWYRVA